MFARFYTASHGVMIQTTVVSTCDIGAAKLKGECSILECPSARDDIAGRSAARSNWLLAPVPYLRKLEVMRLALVSSFDCFGLQDVSYRRTTSNNAKLSFIYAAKPLFFSLN
jgi:hypothetical protein